MKRTFLYGIDAREYARRHYECEIWPHLPYSERRKNGGPLIPAGSHWQHAEITHHLHRGCNRIDHEWNIIRVCAWSHWWIHDAVPGVDNEQAARCIAIRGKMRDGTWNGDQAFALTGMDMIGQLCGWKPPERLAWVRQDWLEVTRGHKARERR